MRPWFTASSRAVAAATLVVTVAVLAPGCGGRDDLTISAASSLTDAFRQVSSEFERTGSAAVSLNFAASGVLEAQVRAGAPVAVIASASPAEPEALFADGLVEEPVEFARNKLVAATRAGLPPLEALGELRREDIERIAIGSPATVPSGRYARQSLENSGLLDELEERLVPCENVRQALAYLGQGEVDAALVYATDVTWLGEPLPALAIADSLHEPIRYLVSVVLDAGPGLAPHSFVRFLISEEGQSVLRQHGFLPPQPGR
jgi:molybdate transport system substrate-binding protein